jgi:hypothetical protein
VRVEIARQREDLPVRVLSPLEIPTLAELQGRNGIGKSLTIKLLELLTGHQPWDGQDEAWRTLRERLGPTSVTVSGLRDGQTIEWDLNPDAWPDVPPPDVKLLGVPAADRPVGVEARVDGAPATLEQVRRTLEVHRLVGDETLEDSVAAHVGHMATQARYEAELVRERATSVRRVLAEATQALEPLCGRRERALKEQIEGLRKRREELAAQVEKETRRAERLRQLEARDRTLARIAEMQSSAASEKLREELDRVNEELVAARRERDRKFDAAVADAQLRAKIEEAREEVEHAQALLTRAVEDARRHAVEAGLGEDAEPLEPDEVTELRERVSEEIRRLRETLAAQDAVPLVRRTATAVRRALTRADPQSILDHPIAVIRDGEVTGRELSDGIDDELARLDQAARHPSGEQIEQEIAATSQRLTAIVELERALARRRRHTTALRNRRSTLLELSAGAEGDAGDEYVRLEQEISKLEDRRRDLQGEHFRHAVLLDELAPGESLGRATERLQRDILAAGVVALADLADTRGAVEGQLRDIDYEVRRTGAELEEAERDLASAQERRALAVQALDQTTLLQAMGDTAERFAADDGPRAAEELLRAVERVTTSLNRLDAEATGVAGAFAQIDRPAEKLPPDQDVSRIDRVRAEAEREIVAALNQDVLRKELFDGGRVVAYDHRRKVVTFRLGEEGEPLTRSLAAFSSGERVFAYTQMRLRAIRERAEPTANRVVVLDEFGAFLESRRIGALEDLVRGELLGHGIDRVLFILPLTTSVKVNAAGFAILDRTQA